MTIQQFKKIQSNYDIVSINQMIVALSNWCAYLEHNNFDKLDKHLIKDLRRHKDRLYNIRKELELKGQVMVVEINR